MTSPTPPTIQNVSVPAGAIVDTKTGFPTPPFWAFLVQVWNRTGAGAPGSSTLSPLLDTITKTAGSLLYRGVTMWDGLAPGMANQILQMSAALLPVWEYLSGANFGPQAANTFFAGPNGAPGDATFRLIQTADLDSTAGQFPGTDTNDDALAGNVGEYISAQVGSGSAVALTTATPADIASINLTPGDWDVWAGFTSAPAPTTTVSDVRAWINTASATDPGPPNSGAYREQSMAIAAGLSQTAPIGSLRVPVPKTVAGGHQTMYLSIEATFAVAALSAYGFIGARRRR